MRAGGPRAVPAAGVGFGAAGPLAGRRYAEAALTLTAGFVLGLKFQPAYLALEAATRPAAGGLALVRPDASFWVLPAMLTGLLLAHGLVRFLGRRLVPPAGRTRRAADPSGAALAWLAVAALAAWTAYGAAWSIQVTAAGVTFARPFRAPAVYRWSQVRAVRAVPGRPDARRVEFADGRIWTSGDWPSAAEDDDATVARVLDRFGRPTWHPS